MVEPYWWVDHRDQPQTNQQTNHWLNCELWTLCVLYILLISLVREIQVAHSCSMFMFVDAAGIYQAVSLWEDEIACICTCPAIAFLDTTCSMHFSSALWCNLTSCVPHGCQETAYHEINCAHTRSYKKPILHMYHIPTLFAICTTYIYYVELEYTLVQRQFMVLWYQHATNSWLARYVFLVCRGFLKFLEAKVSWHSNCRDFKLQVFYVN